MTRSPTSSTVAGRQHRRLLPAADRLPRGAAGRRRALARRGAVHAGHWEAYRLAPRVPLARGWERQLDIADNGAVLRRPADRGQLRRWLHRLAVRYVAVADAPADYSARAEVRLIRGGCRTSHAVARLRALDACTRCAGPTGDRERCRAPDGDGPEFADAAASTARALVRLRVRWSPYWRLSGVSGCVAPAAPFTRCEARASGTRAAADRLLAGTDRLRSPRCTGH